MSSCQDALINVFLHLLMIYWKSAKTLHIWLFLQANCFITNLLHLCNDVIVQVSHSSDKFHYLVLWRVDIWLKTSLSDANYAHIKLISHCFEVSQFKSDMRYSFSRQSSRFKSQNSIWDWLNWAKLFSLAWWSLTYALTSLNRSLVLSFLSIEWCWLWFLVHVCIRRFLCVFKSRLISDQSAAQSFS